ncbi:MAG TPA: GNAT family N-acetyltransferase [Rhizomicrobium sp.]|jgi:ribosomal protein S18 acetylase RimI-like enzyme
MLHQIRPATMDDRAAIEAIVETAYALYVPRIGRKPAPMTDDYAARITGRQAHVLEDLTLKDGGRIRGFVILVPETGGMLLDNIAVDPTCQGLGFGGSLLAFAEEKAREAGHRHIRLYTNAAMTENIARYLRIGYVETGRGGEKGFCRVYMEKRLD